MSRREKVEFQPNLRRLKIVSWILGGGLEARPLVCALFLEWGCVLAFGGEDVGPCAEKSHFRSRAISRKFMTNRAKHNALRT